MIKDLLPTLKYQETTKQKKNLIPHFVQQTTIKFSVPMIIFKRYSTIH